MVSVIASDRVVWAQTLARDFVSCAWTGHLTLTVSLSTQVPMGTS